MSRVDAAAADRLPWLPDEPAPKPARKSRNGVVTWAAGGAMLVVAAIGSWMGLRSVQEQSAPRAVRATPSTTVRLPEVAPAQPQVRIPSEPVVRQSAQPEVRPAPVREVRIPIPHTERSAPREATQGAEMQEQPAQSVASQPTVAAPAPQVVVPKPWNPRVFSGAAGRVVQIGAFGSIHQAKVGWWHMVRSYPAMSRLPAVVRPTRNSKGRVFYRFQVGTTSQAHSEVLCQRMENIRFSCAVVGLPWKAKVER